MTIKQLPYEEILEQVLLIIKDDKLTLQEIDESLATLLKFYGWKVREFLSMFSAHVEHKNNDIKDTSLLGEDRIKAIEYFTLSDLEKEESITFNKISRLPLQEIDGKLEEHIIDWIDFLKYMQELENTQEFNDQIVSYKRFLRDEDFVLAIAEENDIVKHWQDIEHNITDWLYINGWWLDEVCKKADNPQMYPNLYWYVKLAKHKNILPTYNFTDNKWEWSDDNRHKWENR